MSHQVSQPQPADAISAGLSSLCLMHCLLLPIIVSFSPVLGLLSEEWVHQALVIVTLPISLSVLGTANRGLSRSVTLCLISIGLVCLFAGAFVEALHDYERHLTVVGGVMLALTHAYRWWTHKLYSHPADKSL